MVEGPLEICCCRLLVLSFGVIAAVLGFKYFNENFYCVFNRAAVLYGLRKGASAADVRNPADYCFAGNIACV